VTRPTVITGRDTSGTWDGTDCGRDTCRDWTRLSRWGRSPLGPQKRIPAGGGDPFSLRGNKDPRQLRMHRDGTRGSGWDTKDGTGLLRKGRDRTHWDRESALTPALSQLTGRGGKVGTGQIRLSEGEPPRTAREDHSTVARASPRDSSGAYSGSVRFCRMRSSSSGSTFQSVFGLSRVSFSWGTST